MTTPTPTGSAPDQTALVERLEAAEVGSRELDAAVCMETTHPYGFDHDYEINAFPVTTSLDAALSLAERVLPGWWWTAGKCGLTCHASVGPDRAFIAEPDLSKYDAGFHADIPNPSTPALALCAAILRATGASS